MSTNWRMAGEVTGFDGRYFIIHCPQAPRHLATLHLLPSQCGGAQVGDDVTLEYQVTPTSGLWNVVSIDSTVDTSSPS